MFATFEAEFFWRAAIALTVGMFIGVERERSALEDGHPPFAGIRTFPICALIGLLAAMAGGAPLLVAGLIGVAAITAVAYFRSSSAGHPGITTETAFLLTYLIGAVCGFGLEMKPANGPIVAASVTLVVTTLLVGRERLHGFAKAVSEKDLASVLKFGMISIVVLPLIPNREFGGINFHGVWMVVILISGIGFAGYVLTKIVGPRAGTGLAGLVGGLVSSTVVTLTFSKKSRETPELSLSCALAIVAACTVLYLRIGFFCAVINPAFALELAPILLILFAISLLVGTVLYKAAAGGPVEDGTPPEYKNPVELVPAIKFAAAFAAITWILRYAQAHYGASGTFAASFLSGLTDLDAVTLSMAKSAGSESVSMEVGVMSVVLALLANTLAKLGFALWLGSPKMRPTIAWSLGLSLVATAVAIGVARLI